jgi:tripartite-type tricarboxylate transporter receptor subunit TctC
MHGRPSAFMVVVLLVVTSLACAPGASGGGAAGASAPRAAAKPAAQAAVPAGQAAPAAPRPDLFAGKTITALVNFSAGGPTDVFARMLGPYLEKHLPGQPKIIVENKPGGGGAIGANQLYNASRKDGFTMGVLTGPFAHQLMDGDGVQYDSAGFLWLGGVSEASVSYANASLGVKTAADLPRATGEIVAGGLSPDSSKDLTLRTYLNMFGLKYRYVTGYPGQADINLAFRRGEVNYAEESLTSWATNGAQFVKEGTAFPTSQRGILRGGQIVRDPRVREIPTHLEAGVELKGEPVKQSIEYRAMTIISQMNSLLRAIVYPPGVNAEMVEAMRQGVATTFADPEFQATAERQLGFQFVFVSGHEAQDQSQIIMQQAREDAEALDYLKRLAREKN